MDSVFQKIYTQYHQELFQFLYYMVNHRQEAEDLVQEVYIRVLKSYSKFEGKSSEKTWLFSIAKNVAIDHFRKQKGWKQRLLDKFDWDRQTIADTTSLPEEIAIKNEEVHFLIKSLTTCPTNYRLVLIMRFLNGFSIAETAEALNWTESKVKTTQHRAMKLLREKMKDHLEKEDRNRASI